MSCCIFKDCYNRPRPFSKLTFFNVPKDNRRGIWLALSGNEDVEDLPLNSRRAVCEIHFSEKYLRRQFQRTTLSRDAIPLNFNIRKDTPRVAVPKVSIGVRIGMLDTYHEVPDSSSETNPADLESEFTFGEGYFTGQRNSSENNFSARDQAEQDDDDDDDDSMQEDSFSQNDESNKRKLDKRVDDSTPAAGSSTAKQARRLAEAEDHEPPQAMTQHCTKDSSDRISEEEHYALSLVGPLQRLPPNKRAVAKVKILSYLTQLECGMDVEL
ncbi:uncharacterized protein LOC129777979 [Toxorhynchites rutilus septentrionalis]|uniref:uncharacterized protein LOC129777979 n=1 Tax=Toxorhynchites rutilus septentrionalis TaxID=329112 RepID=UPI00247A0DCD|nr:uncharacterized protein LOC129777979 [Toxorhynchites rutilus septentrionalis]